MFEGATVADIRELNRGIRMVYPWITDFDHLSDADEYVCAFLNFCKQHRTHCSVINKTSCDICRNLDKTFP